MRRVFSYPKAPLTLTRPYRYNMYVNEFKPTGKKNIVAEELTETHSAKAYGPSGVCAFCTCVAFCRHKWNTGRALVQTRGEMDVAERSLSVDCYTCAIPIRAICGGERIAHPYTWNLTWETRKVRLCGLIYTQRTFGQFVFAGVLCWKEKKVPWNKIWKARQ